MTERDAITTDTVESTAPLTQPSSFDPSGPAEAGIPTGIRHPAGTDATDESDATVGTDVPVATGEPTRRFRAPLVTTRVGIFFVTTAVSLLILALVAHGAPSDTRLHSVLWVAAITVCALGGLTSMGSVRTLRTIESELRRIADSPHDAKAARPIIGFDDAVSGWNTLLEHAHNESVDPGVTRRNAALDREAVTLARAMRGLPVAWVITGTDGRIRFLNPAACALLGLDEAAENVDRDLPQLIGLRDPDDESAAELLNELLGSVRMVNARQTLTLNTRPIDLRITRSILDGRTGDGKGLAWVLNDITQQQLATRARDQFLMTATHELRTPLNNLHGYAEALQSVEQLDVEQQKEFCNVIVAESHRLGRLVDQMLSVGQMEAGSMVANRHELEILPLVEYAIQQMGGHAEQKQITLEQLLAPKLPTVQGDRDKLQAALVNLIGNAIKYTPSGGEVIVSATAEDSWIQIGVQDNGCGIPDDDQPKIFEKFFRGSNAEDADGRGNGLGLSFAQEVSRLHGGEITFESQVGEGSTFTLRLPVGGTSRSGI